MNRNPIRNRRGRRRTQTPAAVGEPKRPEAPGATPAPKKVFLPRAISVVQLADALQVSPIEVMKQLIRRGVMASVNQVVDYDTATAVARDFNFEVEEPPKPQRQASVARPSVIAQKDQKDLKIRPPVVTILGHVDHGKTTLLDAIRKTNVVASEVGGITQHIGAYQIEQQEQKITFLDTPGHEAFTAMRARGAQVTDIAILVVAADDGVMPQTVEAIDHVKAAGVPIIVAINKIDKPEANPERVKQQLTEHGLVIEEWGGDVIAVPVSAKQKIGIKELLDNILVVAEVSELKANPNQPAEGVVIEAKLDNTRGPVATVLVRTGTLKLGDIAVVGGTWGRIKAMFSDSGKRIKRAEPSTPVEVLGLDKVPMAGDRFQVATSEKSARSMMLQERPTLREGAPTTLETALSQVTTKGIKELNIVLKTDVQGSIEPIRDSLEGLSTEKARLKVLHVGTGSITEGDILLAIASKGIVIGFNSRPEPGARHLAETEGVDIRFYNIIYNLVDDVRKALEGILEPVITEVREGVGEVKAIFPAGKQGKVAGVFVSEGKLARGAPVRVIRGGKVLHTSSIASLRHFKEDVREMNAGMECGVAVEGFQDFQPGDILETFRKTKAGQPA